MKNMAILIRRATRDDAGEILNFIRALAAYEREPDAVVATEEDLVRDGFGDSPYYQCLIAESDGNDARLVKPRELGGHGLHATWSDDFHHALHTLLTGESRGYY